MDKQQAKQHPSSLFFFSTARKQITPTVRIFHYARTVKPVYSIFFFLAITFVSHAAEKKAGKKK